MQELDMQVGVEEGGRQGKGGGSTAAAHVTHHVGHGCILVNRPLDLDGAWRGGWCGGREDQWLCWVAGSLMKIDCLWRFSKRFCVGVGVGCFESYRKPRPFGTPTGAVLKVADTRIGFMSDPLLCLGVLLLPTTGQGHVGTSSISHRSPPAR
jgi:hypothetical protein